MITFWVTKIRFMGANIAEVPERYLVDVKAELDRLGIEY